MRKAIVVLVLGVLATSPAFASTPWAEFFNYPDGGLTTVGLGWATHSGTGTDVQVVSGQAVVSSAQAPDVNNQFRTPAEATATDIVYASFNLKISGTQTAAGGYFAHFMNTGTFFAARVFALLNDATTYKIGISTTSTLATSAIWPTPLNKDQTYSIAIRYNAATGVSTLWVDPTSTSGGLDSPAGPTGTLVSGFALRQATGYGTATIDDIRVDVTEGVVATDGETWGGVKALFR